MMKKLVLLSTILCLFLTGCEKENVVINEYGNEVSKIGPYIEICSQNAEDCYGYCYKILTCYREDNKIIYEIIVRRGGSGGISIQELYSYDDKGHPILQFYEDGKIVTK